MGWRDSAPVYVTRKDAHDVTGTYSLSLWMSLSVLLLVWLNAIVWGIVGLIVAGRVLA